MKLTKNFPGTAGLTDMVDREYGSAMEIARVKAVLFDVDGTLIDSVPSHAAAWHAALAKHGFEIETEAIRTQIGKGADIMIPDLLPDTNISAELMSALGDTHKKIFHTEYLAQLKGFAGVSALFSHLIKDGKKLALASSAHGEELDQFKKIAGIQDFDLPQASSDDVRHSKPYPDIFQEACRILGNIEPNCCVVVGDSPHDVRAARRANMQVVGVLCGGFSEEMLRSAGCDIIYHDIAALHQAYRRKHDEALIKSST